MRTAILLFIGSFVLEAQAQLTNPGFEELGAGWGITCTWNFSTDVPSNGGQYSLRLPMISGTSPECFIEEGVEPVAFQELPGMQNGDELSLHFWCKGEAQDPSVTLNLYVEVALGWMTSADTFDHNPWGSVLIDTTWTPIVGMMTCTGIPDGHTPALFLGGRRLAQPPAHILLDNVSLEWLTVGMQARASPQPVAYPVPADEHVHVELVETVIDVRLIDTWGRRHTALDFGHEAGILQVDVGHLPPGLCVLEVRTAAGLSRIRFIKA